LELIDRSVLDFALIEGSFPKETYGHRLFSRERFVGICAPEHPFAGREVTLPELVNETLICRENGSGTRAILENLLTEYNESISHFRRHITISTFSVIPDLVRKNLGFPSYLKSSPGAAALPPFPWRAPTSSGSLTLSICKTQETRKKSTIL